MLVTTGSMEIKTAEGMAGLIQAREMRGSAKRLFQRPVYRGAANDDKFRTRASRGSVCNGLLDGIVILV